MNKLKYIISAIVILGLLIVVSINHNNKNGSDITIGAILPLTGEGSIDGEDAKKAIDLAVADYKAKGVNVKVVYEDDQTDPKAAVSALRRLDEQGIKAAIGGEWSFLAEAILPIADMTNTVVVSPTTTKEYVQGTSPYFFLAGTENIRKTEPLAAWLKEHNYKSAAVVVSKDGWGQSNKKAFEEAMAEVGGKVLISEEIPFGAEVDTMQTLVTVIKQKNPDVILWTGYEPGAITLIKKTAEQDVRIPIMAATASLVKPIRSGKVSISPSSPLYILDYKVPQEFNDKFRIAYGELPASSYAHRAYDAVFLLVENMRKSSSETLPERIRAQGYQGFGGEYKFTPEGYLRTGSDWVINQARQDY